MALQFEGSSCFRQRIVCATLSGKSIVIKDIRHMAETPGLQDFEAGLLRLVDKITNGCKIEIDVTGTTLYYKPGILIGGRVEHDCGKSRSIGYYLEALALLAPFGKQPLHAILSGITNHNDNLDISVDLFRTVTIPNLNRFGIDEGLELKIKKRGAPPNGGGRVIFRCPLIKSLKPIQLVDMGQVVQVRGVVYTAKMNPNIGSRIARAAKGVLLKHISDVYIYTDHFKGDEAGLSPGFGLSLRAETTSGCLLSYELMGESGIVPEEFAESCATQLLHEILRGGCVDTYSQSTSLVMMAVGPEDVSKIRLGKLSPNTISYLQHIRQFFDVTFQITPDTATKTTLLTCFGCGMKNLAKQSF